MEAPIRFSFDIADCTTGFTVEKSVGHDEEQQFVESCAAAQPTNRMKARGKNVRVEIEAIFVSSKYV